MVPNVSKPGHSFKGAFLYYLHDKRQPGEATRLTSDRVAWTETRNLAVDDPDQAMRLMIATAKAAPELKKAAGVKATGRKAEAGSVLTYSLAWHPDKEPPPDKAEMIRAAELSLKAMKAEHLQAVFVCHTDTKHPHVHVILNRIDPTNGKVATGDEWRRLSKFRDAYEKERGQKLTKSWQEKRREQEQQKGQEQKPPSDRVRLKEHAAMIAELQVTKRREHEQQWKDLAAKGRARRDQIWRASMAAMQDARAAHKAATKENWRDWFKEERRARRAYDRNERALSGMITNAFFLAMQDKKIGREVTGYLKAGFNFMASSGARCAAYEGYIAEQKAAFMDRVKAPLDAQVARIKADRFKQLAEANRSFAAERAALMAQQKAERATVGEAWRQYYRAKEQADELRRHQAKSRSRMEQRTDQNFRHARRTERAQDVTGRRPVQAETARPNVERPTPQPEVKPVRDFFRAALEYEQAQKRTPNRAVEVSAPAPQPAPAGMSPHPSRVVDVPNIDKAAEFAKTPEGQKIIERQAPKAAPDPVRTAARDVFPPQMPEKPKAPAPAPQPAKAAPQPQPKLREEWKEPAQPKAAEPAPERTRELGDAFAKPAAPAPEPAKPQSMADYFKSVRDRAAAEPERDRSRDRSHDFDRER